MIKENRHKYSSKKLLSSEELDYDLPEKTRQIVKYNTLSAAIGYVWRGLKNVYLENKQANKQHNEIMQEIASNKRKLYQLHSSLEDKRQINHIAYHAAELEILHNKEKIAKLGKKYDWTSALGLTSMFTGMPPSVISSGCEVASHYVNPATTLIATSSLHSAAIGLATSSGGALLIGQVATSIYGGNKIRQGLMEKKALKKNMEYFGKHSASLSQRKNVEEIISKKIHFVRKTKIEYGITTIAGQSLSAAGTIAGFTGVGLVATIPLLIISTPVTFGATISRIIYQHREENFKGIVTKYTEDALKDYNLPHLLERHSNPKKILKKLDDGMNKNTDKLAALKLLSLLHHLENDRKYKNISFYKKIEAIEGLLEGDKEWFSKQKNSIKGSGLEKTVGKKVKNLYWKHKDEIEDFLSLRANNANKRIINAVADCLDDGDPFAALCKSADIDIERLPELTKLLNLQNKDTYRQLQKCGHLTDREYSQLARTLLNRSKGTVKAIRFNLADSMVRAAHIMEISKELPAPSKKTPAPITNDRGQLLNNLRANHIAKSIYEGYTPHGYIKFEEISRNIDENGTKIIYRNPFNKTPNADITYNIAPNGKLTIRYNHETNAIIPLHKHINDKITGIELHTISNGKYEGHERAHHHGTGKRAECNIIPTPTIWRNFIRRDDLLGNRERLLA